MSFGPPPFSLALMSPQGRVGLGLGVGVGGSSSGAGTPSSSVVGGEVGGGGVAGGAVAGAPTLGFAPAALPFPFGGGEAPFPAPPFIYDQGLLGFPPLGPGGPGGPLDMNGQRRKNATRETTAALKAWLYEHRKNPYPTKGEKIMLAIITKMTLTQVSTWFANARRRLKKENKMTWSPRNRAGDEDDDLEEEAPSPSPSSQAQPQLHSKSNSNANSRSPSPPSNTGLKDGDEENKGLEKNNNADDPPLPKKAKIWSIADTVKGGSVPDSNPPSLTKGTPVTGTGTAVLPASVPLRAPMFPPPPHQAGPFPFPFHPFQAQINAINAAAFNAIRPPQQFPVGPGGGIPLPRFPFQIQPPLSFPVRKASPQPQPPPDDHKPPPPPPPPPQPPPPPKDELVEESGKESPASSH